MRIVPLFLLCAACSSTTVIEGPSPTLDGSSSDTSTPSDAAQAADTSVAADASNADSGPNTGLCASCTANMCLTELEGCAGSNTCAGNLMSFNNCLTAHGTSCGTTFAAGGSAESTLWTCLKTKCASTCGTM